MIVTNEMLSAAVKQLIRDKILPTHTDMDTYIHNYESVERALIAALGESK